MTVDQRGLQSASPQDCRMPGLCLQGSQPVPSAFFGTPFLSPLTYLDQKSGEEEQAVCKGSKLTTDMAPLMVEPY